MPRAPADANAVAAYSMLKCEEVHGCQAWSGSLLTGMQRDACTTHPKQDFAFWVKSGSWSYCMHCRSFLFLTTRISRRRCTRTRVRRLRLTSLRRAGVRPPRIQWSMPPGVWVSCRGGGTCQVCINRSSTAVVVSRRPLIAHPVPKCRFVCGRLPLAV